MKFIIRWVANISGIERKIRQEEELRIRAEVATDIIFYANSIAGKQEYKFASQVLFELADRIKNRIWIPK